MQLLLFLLRTKAINSFRNKSGLKHFWELLGIIVLGFYAWGFAWLLDEPLVEEEIPELSKEWMMAGLFFLIPVLTLLRGYMPYYRPKTDFLPKIFPLSPGLRYCASLLLEITSPFFLVWIYVLVIITAFSAYFSAAHFALAALLLFGTHLTRRFIQTLTDRKLHWQTSVYTAFALFALGISGLLYSLFTHAESLSLAALVCAVSAVFMLIADYLTERNIVSHKTAKEVKRASFGGNVYFALLLQNKRLRNLIIGSLSFKVVLLSIDAFSGFEVMGDQKFYENLYFAAQFFSPMMLLIGVFNNTWGYFRNLWLTADLAGASKSGLVKITARLLLLPLLLDLAIAIFFVLVLEEDLVFWLIFYFSVLAVGFPVALTASIYQPYRIKSFMQSGKRTSVPFMWVMMIVPLIMVIAIKVRWVFYSYPVFIGFAIFGAMAVFKEYPRFRHSLYERLYKAGE